MACFACVRAPRDDAEPRESEKEIFYDAPSSFERRAPWWAPTLVKSSEVEERRLETDANATATATATTLATTQPKTHADDAFHRALARASSEMEAESRGGSFAAKARAYAKAVTAMASVGRARRQGGLDVVSRDPDSMVRENVSAANGDGQRELGVERRAVAHGAIF